MISGNNTTGSARVYRRVDSLVRAGVPAFLLAAPLRAYILTHSKMGKWECHENERRTRIKIGILHCTHMHNSLRQVVYYTIRKLTSCIVAFLPLISVSSRI